MFVLICAMQSDKCPVPYRKFGEAPYLIPLCFPVFGEYDGYGGVMNITEDESTKWLGEKTGMCVEKICEIIINNAHRRLDNEDAVQYRMIKEVLLQMTYLCKDYDLCVTMDHIEIYKTVSKLCLADAWESYEISLKNENLVENARICEIRNEYKNALNWESEYLYKFGSSDIMNINPAVDTGYWGNYGYGLSGYVLLGGLMDYGKANYTFWKEERWRVTYVEFMSFWRAICRMCWPVTMFRWGGQDNMIDWYGEINKTMGGIIEKKLRDEEDDI